MENVCSTSHEFSFESHPEKDIYFIIVTYAEDGLKSTMKMQHTKETFVHFRDCMTKLLEKEG